MHFKSIIFLSFLEFILAIIIGGNYLLSIQEYAVTFGSDELIIFNHAEIFLETGSLYNLPLKYVISSLFIAFSLKFGALSLLALFFFKYLMHLLSVFILLRSIHSFVDKSSFKIFAVFLYLNPVFHYYHTTILRDDLILSFALVMIGYSIRVFDKNIYLSTRQKMQIWFILIATIFIGTGLRPELFLLLTLFLGFTFFISLELIKRIIFIFIMLVAAVFYGKPVLLIYDYALLNAGWFDFKYVPEAFRVFLLSPAPWNIITILNDVDSDARDIYLWYYLSFFGTSLSLILFPWYAFKKKSILFKISVNNPIGMWFFYFPLFVTVSYGLIASSMVFLGPRQGILSSALLTLIFINCLIFLLASSGKK